MTETAAYTVRITYQPAGAGREQAGQWVADCADCADCAEGGARVAGGSLEEALRGMASILAESAGGPVELAARIEPGLAMDPGVCGGRVRVEETELTIERLLRTLAQEGSLTAVSEHYPILAEEDVAAAIEFAARVLGSIRVPPAGARDQERA